MLQAVRFLSREFRNRDAFVSVLGLLLFLALPQAARAETYVAGQAGYTIPADLSNVRGTGAVDGIQTSDLALKPAFMYGAKVGHYLQRARWKWLQAGIEAEAFNSTPHIKQQMVVNTIPGVGTTPPFPTSGATMRMTTAALNIMTRFLIHERLEPYAGVGVAIFLARVTDAHSGEAQSSTTPGLNALVGLRYRLAGPVSLFAEWKFNHTRLRFSETNDLKGFNGTYQAHHVVFGIGYHF